MRTFWLALQFLTRLPTPQLAEVSEHEMGRAALFYPLVGALIGLLLWGVAEWGPHHAPLLQGALILALWVGVTGALHLDGLADMADAWVGGHGDRERTLAIMKDPASGPMGVSAVVILLLLKFAALVSLLPGGGWWLLLAAVLARALVLLLLLTTPYARDSGLGHPLAMHLPRLPAAMLVALAFLLLFVDAHALQALLMALVLVVGLLLYRRALLRRLGGWTGDGAGALIELIEALVVVGAVISS